MHMAHGLGVAGQSPLRLFLLHLASAVMVEPPREATAEPRLSVLLFSSWFVGHQIPMISIGEEMVSRGHNVSLLTTEVKGSHVVPQLVERVGMTFISAGPESRTREDTEREMHRLREKSIVETFKAITILSAENLLHIREGVDQLNSSNWDIVLVDVALITIARYITLKWPAVPVIVYNVIPMIFPLMDASWPYLRTAQSPDRGDFWDRLQVVLSYRPWLRLALESAWTHVSSNDPVLADVLCENPYMSIGIGNPVIGSTTFDFEPPRAFLPMVHLVGPVPLKSFPPLDGDLENWLNSKKERKVVYISMGSTAYLTKEMAHALIEGVRATNYSVIWSLRETNRDILDGSILEKEHFYLSRWVSQQAILQHAAIGISILHGGMNGVQESIYYGVPVIAIPFGLDQPLVALRVEQLKLGAMVHSSALTAERVSDCINTVAGKSYRERVKKQSKIFRFAGGSSKAADILEHYADVGYEHLYPAFYKYKWTWVQYYNIDVYLLLGLATCLPFVCTLLCLKSIVKKCRAFSKHAKQH